MICFNVNKFFESRPVQLAAAGGVVMALALAVIGVLAITGVIPGVAVAIGITMLAGGSAGAVVGFLFLVGGVCALELEKSSPISPSLDDLPVLYSGNLYQEYARYLSKEHDEMRPILQRMDEVEASRQILSQSQWLIRGPCAFMTQDRMLIVGLLGVDGSVEWYSVSKSGTNFTQIKKVVQDASWTALLEGHRQNWNLMAVSDADFLEKRLRRYQITNDLATTD